jgi:hypothetical protein
LIWRTISRVDTVALSLTVEENSEKRIAETMRVKEIETTAMATVTIVLILQFCVFLGMCYLFAWRYCEGDTPSYLLKQKLK